MPSGGQLSAGSGLRLQALTPGVQDVGNANISGTHVAGRYRTYVIGPSNTKTCIFGTATIPGRNFDDWGAGSTCIGEDITLGSLSGNVVIGLAASAGNGLVSSAQNSVIIGASANWNGGYGTGQGSVGIGTATRINNDKQTIIGSNNTVNAGAIGVTCLGNGTVANYGGVATFNILIGYNANDSGLANVIRIGTGQAPIPQANKVSIGDGTHVNVQIGSFDLRNGFAKPQFVQTVNISVANTAVESTLLGAGRGSVLVPAGSLVVGSIIRVMARGVVSDTGVPTLQFRLKIGGVTFCDFGATAFPTLSGTHGWCLQADVTIRTIGVGGSAIGNGIAAISVSGAPDLDTLNTATSAINTTTDNTVELTAQWGTADPANTITSTNVSIEVIG